jgi:transcription elongation factor Elf1
MSEWREGARRNDPADACPLCGKSGVLRWDFKKFGQHSFVYCESCKAVCVDGKRAADVKEGP